MIRSPRACDPIYACKGLVNLQAQTVRLLEKHRSCSLVIRKLTDQQVQTGVLHIAPCYPVQLTASEIQSVRYGGSQVALLRRLCFLRDLGMVDPLALIVHQNALSSSSLTFFSRRSAHIQAAGSRSLAVVAPLQGSVMSYDCVYTIFVETGWIWKAGTDSVIGLTLRAAEGYRLHRQGPGPVGRPHGLRLRLLRTWQRRHLQRARPLPDVPAVPDEPHLRPPHY
jgi:hypothetical protein